MAEHDADVVRATIARMKAEREQRPALSAEEVIEMKHAGHRY